MYQLRLPCLDSNSQFLINKNVVVYIADGVTPAPLFNADDEPRSPSFMTDASGFIEFRLQSLITLRFRVLTGTLYSDDLPLYDAGVTPSLPMKVNTVGQGIVGIAPITAGYMVTPDGASGLSLASADNLLHFSVSVGVATQTGNTGDAIQYVSSGYITNTGWAFTTGKPLFLGLNGELIQAPLPSTLTFIQQIGVAVSATTAMISISPAIKR